MNRKSTTDAITKAFVMRQFGKGKFPEHLIGKTAHLKPPSKAQWEMLKDGADAINETANEQCH